MKRDCFHSSANDVIIISVYTEQPQRRVFQTASRKEMTHGRNSERKEGNAATSSEGGMEGWMDGWIERKKKKHKINSKKRRIWTTIILY